MVRDCLSGDNTRRRLLGCAQTLSARMFRSILCVVAITFGALTFSTADAADQFRIGSWTTDNGLPQVSINTILQTRDGFLWVTTYGGLVRYDGLRFQVFNTGNTQGLRTSRFTGLFEDREGTLWINTEGKGLPRY